MKLVVLDSNIWVSAIAFGGRMRGFIDAMIRNESQAVISEDLLEETVGVLGGRKIGFSSGAVMAAEAGIRGLTRVVRPLERLRVVKEDPDDDRVLECALFSVAAIIVSGDRHLLSLATYRGVRIVSPGAFMAEMADNLKQGEADSGADIGESRAVYHVKRRKLKSRR